MALGDNGSGNIACGSFVPSAIWGSEETIGWEPQYILYKKATAVGDWFILDNIRGIVSGGNDPELLPNTSEAERTYTDTLEVTPTGFKQVFSSVDTATYIYMAIRRPMKTPLSSDEVFAIDTSNGVAPTFDSGFVVDMAIQRLDNVVTNNLISSRLTAEQVLKTNLTDAEYTSTGFSFDYMKGWRDAVAVNPDFYSWMFKRAKGFFDVVAYTGTGVARTVNHNLGVVPEMMIVKSRSDGTRVWCVYSKDLNVISPSNYLKLNTTDAAAGSNLWNDTRPTSTVFSLFADNEVNAAAGTYIAYLFATLAGISKVGSYTGNGTSQTIDAGFSTGAKFILIKRTDSTGDWFMWDTVRGIVAGNDPHLSLNATAAEVTTDDSIDTDTSGFIVNQNATTNINVTSATYIYYSIATPL